jgi:catechol-2,3-dioxygenase
MRVELASVLVDDRDTVLEFYAEILGFVKKTEARGHV